MQNDYIIKRVQQVIKYKTIKKILSKHNEICFKWNLKYPNIELDCVLMIEKNKIKLAIFSLDKAIRFYLYDENAWNTEEWDYELVIATKNMCIELSPELCIPDLL